MNEENFLAKFKDQAQLDSVSFMQIWSHYDRDQSGYIEDKSELEQLARDMLQAGGEAVTELALKDFVEGLSELYDANADHRLGLAELASILPLEKNFLAQFNGRPALSEDELKRVFDHYDADGSGSIQGDELLALMRDLLRRYDREPSKAELDLYTAQVLGFLDGDGDGGIALSELARLFTKD